MKRSLGQGYWKWSLSLSLAIRISYKQAVSMCFINIHYIIRPQFSRLQGNALYNKDSILGNGKRRAWQGWSIGISFILLSLFNGETFPVADFQEQNGYCYLAQIDIELRLREHAEHHFRSVLENEENSLQLAFWTHKTLLSLVILKLLQEVNKLVRNWIGHCSSRSEVFSCLGSFKNT